MDFKWTIIHLFLRENVFKPTFSPILLSERNTGIDYAYNILDHKNPL